MMQSTNEKVVLIVLVKIPFLATLAERAIL